MTRWSIGLALALLAAGVLVLGTTWEGIEVAPGVWRDSVSLGQWAALWVMLVVIAMAGAGRLPRLSQRALAPVPLLVWIGWSLRGGTLTPLAFVIYAVPTVAAWGVGLGLGDGMRFLARTVKRGGS